MFILYGTRTARIKNYKDNQQACKNCKMFDFDVKVYQNYYHFFFIPICPVGDKTADVHCTNCGQRLWISSIQKEYELKSKAPFYLYSGIILFVGLILGAIYLNLNNQKQKAILVQNPKIGDVYTMRKDINDSTKYFFCGY